MSNRYIIDNDRRSGGKTMDNSFAGRIREEACLNMVVPEPAPLMVIGEVISKSPPTLASSSVVGSVIGIEPGRKSDNICPGKCVRFGNGRPQRTSTAGIGTTSISGGGVLCICGCIYDEGRGVRIQGENLLSRLRQRSEFLS